MKERPLLHLPVVQNWDCHGCSHCCREYDVAVTDAERQRIEAQGWHDDPDIGTTPLFVRAGLFTSAYRLNHRKDRGCIFLTSDNRCKIHEKHGEAAKPLACRLFPFVLVPVDKHWRVGVRYACPSAAEDRGSPLTEHENELKGLAHEYGRQQQLEGAALSAPALQGRQRVDWPDVLRLVNVLQGLMGDDINRVERRWRKCLALARMCRQAKFDAVTGKRLDEFLEVLCESLDDEVPRNPADVPAPSWIGRLLFRHFAAMYARKDRGPWRGLVRHGRLALLNAGIRFAVGRGAVPKLNSLIGDVTFADLEEPSKQDTAAIDEILARYYIVKLNSLQFFGPLNFGQTLWDGLDALALTYPLVVWLARAIESESPARATMQAFSVVDDHFGYNPVLGARRYRYAQRILSQRDELVKLVAWYAR